jgi:hypothetical protein
MSELIEYYVDFLIDQKFTQRGQYLEPGRAAEIKRDLERELDQYLMKRMLSALSGQDLIATAEMRARGVPAEEIENFAKAHISDFKNFFAGVLRDFGRVYLGYALCTCGPAVGFGSWFSFLTVRLLAAAYLVVPRASLASR